MVLLVSSRHSCREAHTTPLRSPTHQAHRLCEAEWPLILSFSPDSGFKPQAESTSRPQSQFPAAFFALELVLGLFLGCCAFAVSAASKPPEARTIAAQAKVGAQNK